jgi:dihydropteroate synthase
MADSHARAASQGVQPVALMLDSLQHEAREALVASAQRQGVECLTGDGWALLAGSASRLAGLARPGFTTLPASLAEALGSFLKGIAEPPAQWTMARGAIALDRPVVVGVLNVTPDSFSDGGRFLEPSAAARHAAAMIEAGADMIDVGAESTRPGRPEPVSSDEEWRRLAPVLTALAERFPHVPLSVDSVKAATAARALAAGAWAINDVSGLRLDPALADVCAAESAGLILMHSRGSLSEMATYDHARYEDVAADTITELRAAVKRATDRRVRPERIVLDPGIGFAKTPQQSFAVLRGLPALTTLGFPVMVGPSRKRFLGVTAGEVVDQRDEATAAVCVAASMLGAHLFRVHDVSRVRRAVDVALAVRTP